MPAIAERHAHRMAVAAPFGQQERAEAVTQVVDGDQQPMQPLEGADRVFRNCVVVHELVG